MAEFDLRWRAFYDGPAGPMTGLTIGDSFFPQAVELEAAGLRGGPSVYARFEIRDGIPETVTFKIDASPKGRAVRTVDIRGWTSLETLAANAFQQFARRHQHDASGTPLGATRPTGEREWWASRADIEDAQAVRRGPSGTELEEVARIYRGAIAGRPTEAVQVMLGYSSRRTAARRVQQARAAGLLPPTSPGRKKA